MIKIALISEFQGGGVEKVNTLVAQHLDKEKFDLLFISLVTDPDTLSGKKIPYSYVCLNVKRKKNAFRALINTLRSFSPDIILTSCMVETYFALLYKWIFSRTAKVIYAQHSVWTKNYHTIKSIFLNKYVPRITRGFDLVDGIVFVSQGVKEDFVREFPRVHTMMKVLYNPIVSEDKKVRIKKPDMQELKIVTAGRMEPEKNHGDIIEAVKILHEMGINAHLTILGTGSEMSQLKDKARDCGVDRYIIFKGFVDNVAKIYSKQDIFVLASSFEAFGNVIIEAMNVGLPVITTDCPVGPSEILCGGTYGTLVPIHDARAIAKGIIDAVNEYNEERIMKAYQRSRDFSIERSIHGYEKMFEEMVVKQHE